MPCKVHLLPIEDQKKIISLCTEEFIPTAKVSEMYNIPSRSIIYFLQKEGINLPKLRKEHFEALAKAATEDHISGMLLKDAATKYGICTSTIEKYMKKHNIFYRNQHGRKNFFNQDFFHEINSEASAYYLGFLFADGCITNVGKEYTRPCRISINISQKDRCLLEQFLKVIEATGNLHIRDYIPCEKTYSNHPMSRITLNSTRMADDLIQLGFKNTKDTRMSIPNIAPQYMRHFVRGYFEGDGCATVRRVEFTGYVGFLMNLAQILQESLHLPLKEVHMDYKKRTTELIGNLSYSTQEQRSKLLYYMYHDAHYFLPRKKQQIINTLT